MIPISILGGNISIGVDYSDQGAELVYIDRLSFDKIIGGLAKFDIETKTVVDVPPVEIEPEEATVPKSVKRYQIRLAIIESGMDLDSIDNMIKSIPGVSGQKLRVLRFDTPMIHRDSEDLISFAGNMDISDEQLDSLFSLGATL